MPRKLPTQHRHEPPTEPGAHLVLKEPNEHVCPNGDRIAALERQFENFMQNFEQPEQLPAVIDNDASEHNEQRFMAMTRQITSLREQVSEVANLPRLSPDDVNNLTTAMNTRVQTMIEDAIGREVTKIKIRMSSVERSSGPSLANEVEMLGAIVTETGKLVAALDERGRSLETEVTEAKAAFRSLRNEFNTDLSNSLQAVVATLQEVHA